MRTVALLAMVAVLPLLAGCTAVGSDARPSPSATPPSFPRVAGAVVAESQPTPGDWTLSVRVADAAAAYRSARALLTSHGFQLTNDEPAADGGTGQACTTDLCVGFVAIRRPGAQPTVEYEVFHSTGVAG